MADVIENDDELTGKRDSALEDSTDLTKETKVTTSAPAPAPTEDKLGKFKGKSPEDIAAAYEELEKRFGKQGEEVGELRRLSDSLLRSDLERRQSPAPSKTEPQATDIDDAAFFVDPIGTMKKILAQNETIKSLEAHKAESQQERAKRITYEKHPDTDEIVANPEFEKWVKASKFRSDLFIKAANFDADAADELFSTFKTIKSITTSPTPAPKEAADTTAIVETQKRAATAATGTAGGGESSGGKPIYSRIKLMQLRESNPDEYEARNAEFLAAYAEGRVKR